MKYENQILQAFQDIGFTPRAGQIETINSLLTGFLDDGHKTIVLSAPTGVGKSIIAAVTAEALHSITKPNQKNGASFLLSPTNILSDQYFDTFMTGRDPWNMDFMVVKGASNYDCSALTTDDEYVTAENCGRRMFLKNGLQAIIDEHCNNCTFQKQKTKREQCRHLITNYAAFFIDRLYMQQMAKRTLCVFDEGHLMNDLYTEFNGIEFTKAKLDNLAENVVESLGVGGLEHTTKIAEIKNLLDVENGVNYENYLDIVAELMEVLNDVSVAADRRAEETNDQATFIKYKRMATRSSREVMKIATLLEVEYDHAFDCKAENTKMKQAASFSIKPIFIGDQFQSLVNADYNLICSATISEEYASTTMVIDQGAYMRIKPVFPRENKKVIFYKPQTLNATTMNSEAVQTNLKNSCVEICGHHLRKNERGVILTPSFVINELIAGHLQEVFPEYHFVVHKRGSKMENIIAEFKHTAGPCVMITPSGYEGMDLSGDLSRFQILVKAPYASLGEARIKHIANKYPAIYQIITLMKLVQGAGRSVRGPTDWAITYMLDTNIQRMWQSKNMAWADEFLSMSKNTLTMEV